MSSTCCIRGVRRDPEETCPRDGVRPAPRPAAGAGARSGPVLAPLRTRRPDDGPRSRRSGRRPARQGLDRLRQPRPAHVRRGLGRVPAGQAMRSTATSPPGAHVGLLMRNQPEFLVSFYGALVRGGDRQCRSTPTVAGPAAPRGDRAQRHRRRSSFGTELVERLTALSDLGQVRLVIAVGAGDVPERDPRCARRALGRLARGCRGPITRGRSRPDTSTSAIQYTSGTTARPKGAVYTHHFLYLYAALCTDSQERTEDDVLTAPLPLYHVGGAPHDRQRVPRTPAARVT